jgi:hypothetical protein
MVGVTTSSTRMRGLWRESSGLKGKRGTQRLEVPEFYRTGGSVVWLVRWLIAWSVCSHGAFV